MRKVVLLLTVFIIVCVSTACESDSPTIDKIQPASIEITDTEITLDDSNNNTYTLTFKSSHDWNIVLTDIGEDKWCSVSPASGKAGEVSVTIIGQANDSPNDRQVDLTIKADDAQATVVIIQKRGSDPNTIYIPFSDENFKKFCLNTFDTNWDGKLSVAEAEVVEEISLYSESTNFASYGIKSLDGIEYFTSLARFYCIGEPIKTIDLSKNTKLMHIQITQTELTNININGCAELEYLLLDMNKLDMLGVHNSSKLWMLSCSNNPLTSIDVSGYPNLSALHCWNTSLSSIDLSTNLNIASLVCHDNPKLTEVWFNTELPIDGEQIAYKDPHTMIKYK